VFFEKGARRVGLQVGLLVLNDVSAIGDRTSMIRFI
jgi:hypothetical protein